MVEVVVQLLLCLQHAVTVTTYVIEGKLQLGRALGAISSPVKSLNSEAFTQRIVLQLVKDLLAEFGGLEPFVVDDSFLDRMPLQRRVSYFSCLENSCIYSYVGACEAL